MSANNSEHRCKSTTKAGDPCRAAATQGGLCFFHANPNKASELGRIGGTRKHHAGRESADPLPRLDSAAGVRDALAALIADVYAGRLNPRAAASLAALLSLQLRAIPAADLEKQVKKLKFLDEF